MLGIFKKDPVKKLQQQHAKLLAEAHRMSTVDRTKADALMAQAAEVEDEIAKLMSDAGS
ncbi:MAG: Lacal_2735 family protein [Flavobacteriales bacterium]